MYLRVSLTGKPRRLLCVFPSPKTIYGGVVIPFPDSNQEEIVLRGMFFYDEEIPFTRSQWRGRFRASRGIGASLSQGQVEMFDEEHEQLLKIISGEVFTITHRIDAHIYSFQKFIDKHD